MFSNKDSHLLHLNFCLTSTGCGVKDSETSGVPLVVAFMGVALLGMASVGLVIVGVVLVGWAMSMSFVGMAMMGVALICFALMGET